MRVLNDEQFLQKAIHDLNLAARFDLEQLKFRLLLYEKGELLSGPHIRQEDLLFLVSGVVQIYGVGIDGRKIPVNLAKKGSVIGDIEYCNARNSNLFSEVLKETMCIGIPVRINRQALDRDIRFLHYLLHEISKKVYLTSVSEATAISVEEKVIQYMKEECENHVLSGIEHATMRVQCSRRQLQRVLKELCERGEIVKIGKGKYRWNSDED